MRDHSLYGILAGTSLPSETLPGVTEALKPLQGWVIKIMLSVSTVFKNIFKI